MNWKSIVSWILRLLVAGILLQTLRFKFTAHPASVHIFDTLGVEPWGRILTGVLELIAAALILMPWTVVYGALLSAGLMVGAVLSHVFKLGIAVEGDGGWLFFMGVSVLVMALVLVYMRREELDWVKKKFLS